jgi:AbrB family looped-hinge helix DNA binding protein
MEIVKITSKGRIALPKRLRQELDLKAGDEVAFIRNGNTYMILNSKNLALRKA